LAICTSAVAAINDASARLDGFGAVACEPVVGERESNGKLARAGRRGNRSAESYGNVVASSKELGACPVSDSGISGAGGSGAQSTGTDGNVEGAGGAIGSTQTNRHVVGTHSCRRESATTDGNVACGHCGVGNSVDTHGNIVDTRSVGCQSTRADSNIIEA
jgi:hypothetical protein